MPRRTAGSAGAIFRASGSGSIDLIRDTGANGILILSGDRHIGALYRQSTGVPYPLIEITSSGINQVFPSNREAGPNRVGAVYGAANFGTIDVDWWERSATLSIRGMNGEPVRRLSVPLQELRPGSRKFCPAMRQADTPLCRARS